jgi:uncharacterized protein (TIGR02145 family)
MRINKSIFSRVEGAFANCAQPIFSIGLILLALSCEKTNPVKNNTDTFVFGTMTDIDGNSYKTIQIGDQVWMAEDLRTTKYNDGSVIRLVTDSAAWSNLTTPGYCYYNNTTNADSIIKFGALYNWYAVNTGKLAPAGWHVPNDADWNTLVNYLVSHGYNWDGTTDTTTYNKTAKSLAAKTDWYTIPGAKEGAIANDLAKNNRSGFSALPGGARCGGGSFGGIGGDAGWWIASEDSASGAYVRGLSCLLEELVTATVDNSCGFSVRLVKD